MEYFDFDLPRVSQNLPQFIPLPLESWKYINDIDTSKIKSWEEFLPILQTLSGKNNTFKFRSLEMAIQESYGNQKFFGKLLPFMIEGLLKKSQDLLSKRKYTFLRQKNCSKIELSPAEISALFVNMYFSTFRYSFDWAFNDVHFIGIHNSNPQDRPNRAKQMMFLNYFERLMNGSQKREEGRPLIIERLYKKQNAEEVFVHSKKPFQKVAVLDSGKIEDATESRQVDFANMYIGGGVSTGGSAQEEIRFSINPELVVSLLFCPCMFEDEVVVISNIEIFSSYSGYGESLRYGGDFRDEFVGSYEVVAMDALDLRGKDYQTQWGKDLICRDLWKSFLGFKGGLCRRVSTGNWGCGAFRGDRELKFVIQWLSSSQNDKEMNYFTFGRHIELSEKFRTFVNFVIEKKICVGDLFKKLISLKDLENESTVYSLMKII